MLKRLTANCLDSFKYSELEVQAMISIWADAEGFSGSLAEFVSYALATNHVSYRKFLALFIY